MSQVAPIILQADRKLGETRLLRTELRRRGAVVQMAETLDQAVDKMKDRTPDLVILDEDIGEAPSGDLVGSFRSALPDAEIILLSSRGKHMTRGVGRGLLFHGLRPISAEMLLDVIAQAMPGRLPEGVRSSGLAPMVMCVDDEPEMLRCLSRLLIRHGYRVAAFDHPERVLEAIPEVAPDVMLLDVAMPGLDGRELSRQIRSQYRGQFPIVMHTARRTDADRCSGFRHGADYYLPKPCEPHELLDVVDYFTDRLDAEEREFIEERL
jgi:DNA-binding response OmpR family regulator